MRTAAALFLCVGILTLCAARTVARESTRTGGAIMKTLTDEELVDPRLESAEMRDLLTAAQVDTYCIVWYDFEQMDWQGWTQVDNTAQVDTFFHIDDFAGLGGGTYGGLVPLEGTKSMWCGVRDWAHQSTECPGDYSYLCSWIAAPGYGNNWDQGLGWASFPFTCPLVVSYKLRCDIEPEYDYVIFEGDNIYYYPGDNTELARFDGRVDTVVTHTILTTTAWTKLRFRFVSDGEWSDQDGLYDTDGAVIVDSITISDAVGLIDYEDFESYPVCISTTHPYGSQWSGHLGDAYGNYSGLYTNLYTSKDPCNHNYATQIVFFLYSPFPADPAYYPEPGLFNTPFCMGPGGTEAPCQDEMVVSPVIDLTKYSSNCDAVQDAVIPPGELAGLNGKLLRFTAYLDLPTSNLVFYNWYVREIDPSGCPGLWTNRNFWYFYTPVGYVQCAEDFSDLVTADGIQVALQCVDMCDVWYQFYGDCANHTPAPWFDNVRLYRYDQRGPQWSYRDIDLFQDNFPEEEFFLESYIRADCANDLRANNDPVIDPGDSIVVSCNARAGIDTMPDGSPRVYMHVRCPYVGDPLSPKPALYGPSLEGNYGTYISDDGSEWTTIRADYARSAAGIIAPNKYAFDLNDSLFTRGYRIDYYFEAYDLDGESSTLPEDPCDYTYFEWACLPTLASDILYVDDYNRGAPPKGIAQVYYDWTFFHLQLGGGTPDRYDVNGPSSAVSNGLGSRAKNYHLTTAYQKIIWDSGNLESCTISEGTEYSDKSNDAQILVDWMEFSPHRVGLWVCGDDVAADLAAAPSGIALTLLTAYCGVLYVGDSYYDLSGIVAPQVEANLNVGNPLWHSTWGDSFYVFGGCPTINQFDYLEKTDNGEYALDYPDVGGLPYYAGIYSVGVNDGGYAIRTMWFGFSFMYIRDVEPGAPIMRNLVARDILAWMENSIGYPPSGEDDIPLANALSQNYPNPFNPVTTITFSLKEKGHASLKIYDVAGRLVRTLVDDVRKAGHYEERWDGMNNGGHRVASGVYFYRFHTDGFERTRKMVLLR